MTQKTAVVVIAHRLARSGAPGLVTRQARDQPEAVRTPMHTEREGSRPLHGRRE